RKTLRFSREQDVQEVEFYLSSEKSGMQHYTIEVAPLEGEYTTKNNLSHAYVDVIEGRERILILALTPHPDIKALKSALESKENYQVEVHIPGINKFKEEKYDLVIYHQIPDYSNSAQALLDKFLNKTSSLFIVGNQTNLQKFNEINSLVSVNSRSWQKDHVSPVFNSSFERFKFKTEEYTVLNKYPPLTVPYGDFTTKENAETILFQKVGNLTTNKPLVLINKDASEFKSGVIAGEGIWQWRMNEFAETGETKAFDKFFTSLSQYLSSKEDKRKFRFYPVSNEFMTTDRILFETEVYNSVYEKVYGQKININITNEEGNTTSYSFVNSEAESRFEVKGLSQGIYKFSASLERGEKGDKVNGEFLIRELALEAMDVTADHALLRALSEQTGGSFTGPLEMASLSEIISKEKAKSIIHSNEEFNEIINLHWLLIILIMLASMEWFVRKYKGGY
ncbi:MAG: VWA domain-containing protein, partial [Cytophagaceae bacterium]